MDLQRLIGILADELGKGLIPWTNTTGNIEFRRRYVGPANLPFSVGTLHEGGVIYDRLVISAERLKGHRWIPKPNSKFSHDPQNGEILYSDNGVCWVLKFQRGNIVLLERNRK